MKSSPARIALFTGNYNHIADGVSLTLNRLVGFLESQGVEVLVFGPTVENPPVKHHGKMMPVPSISAPGRPEYRVSLFMPLHLRQALLDFKPDLVHIATPDILGLQALHLARRHKIPVVSSFHTNFASYLKYYGFGLLEPILWSYLRWFYRNCKVLYVPTISMKTELESNRVSTDFQIWARGVEADKFHPEKRSTRWRDQHGIAKDETAILFLSRLVWEKNLEAVMEVFRDVGSEGSKVKTVVVGDGPALPAMKKAMPETIFTGALQNDQLQTAYASCDVFFFPSDTETFGNVTLEAMASGLPIVAAKAAGNRDLVHHSRNGFLVATTDFAGYAQQLNYLISDRELRKTMGVESRKIAENFDWPVVLNTLMKSYQNLQYTVL